MKYVQIWFFDQIYEKFLYDTNGNVAEFFNAVNRMPEFKSVIGYMNERWVLQQLQNGKKIAFKFRDIAKNVGVSSPPAFHHPEEFEHFEFSDPFDGALAGIKEKLLIPKSKNFPTVDAFFYDKNQNTLDGLQFTVSQDHSVKVKGLINVLNLTGLMDEFVKEGSSLKIRLFFLIPSDNFNSFNFMKTNSYEKLVENGDWSHVRGFKDIDGISDKIAQRFTQKNFDFQKVKSDLQAGSNLELYPVAVKRYSQYMKQLALIGDLFEKQVEYFVRCYNLDEVIQA